MLTNKEKSLRGSLKNKYSAENICMFDTEFIQCFSKPPEYIQIAVLEKGEDRLCSYYPVTEISNSAKSFMRKVISGKYAWSTKKLISIYEKLQEMLDGEYDYEKVQSDINKEFPRYDTKFMMGIRENQLVHRLSDKVLVGWEVGNDKYIKGKYHLENVSFIDVKEDMEKLYGFKINLSLDAFHSFLNPERNFSKNLLHDAALDAILVDDVYEYFNHTLHLSDSEFLEEKLRLLKYLKKESRGNNRAQNNLIKVRRVKRFGNKLPSSFFNIDYGEKFNFVNLTGEDVIFPKTVEDSESGEVFTSTDNLYTAKKECDYFDGKVKKLPVVPGVMYIIPEDKDMEEHVLAKERTDMIFTFQDSESNERLAFVQDEILAQVEV